MKNIQHYYQQLVKKALFEVIRSALHDISQKGLTGQQHFAITFQSHHEGVILSERVRARHPDEVTIVLQNRYSHLTCDKDALSVTIYFDNVAEHVTIPYPAITYFADPSANFILNLVDKNDKKPAPSSPSAKKPTKKADVISMKAFQKKKKDNKNHEKKS